eukprot:SAG22_NODE_349_length_11854_cov_8.087282_5_plen_111_part_00
MLTESVNCRERFWARTLAVCVHTPRGSHRAILAPQQLNTLGGKAIVQNHSRASWVNGSLVTWFMGWERPPHGKALSPAVEPSRIGARAHLAARRAWAFYMQTGRSQNPKR